MCLFTTWVHLNVVTFLFLFELFFWISKVLTRYLYFHFSIISRYFVHPCPTPMTVLNYRWRFHLLGGILKPFRSKRRRRIYLRIWEAMSSVADSDDEKRDSTVWWKQTHCSNDWKSQSFGILSVREFRPQCTLRKKWNEDCNSVGASPIVQAENDHEHSAEL